MTIEFKYIDDLIDGNLLPAFDVCESPSPLFKLLRFQCKEDLVADNVNGPQITNQKHIIWCRRALEVAISKKADIFLTPEYSFPLELIEEVITDPDLQPPRQKLWCLACQGVAEEKFMDYIEKWKETGAEVITFAIDKDGIYKSAFFGMLIYVFKLNDERIAIVPQLKTQPMADPLIACEAAGLSLGNVIFTFGKGKLNQLCSLICADSINEEVHRTNLFPQNAGLILLHPQLNTKPRHPSFSTLRKDMFNVTQGDKLVYITANWACDSSINPTSDNLKIKNPWSCVYIKNTGGVLPCSQQDRQLRKENFNKGLGFSYWFSNKVNIWYTFKNENLQLISVRKPEIRDFNVAVPLEIRVLDTYVPSADGKQWIPGTEPYFEDDLKTKLTSLNPTCEAPSYIYPINASVENRDYFFGLSFAHLEEGQLLADQNELCNRLALHIDTECEILRDADAQSFSRLIHCLTDHFPSHLTGLKENHKFSLSEGYKYFNLFPEQGDENEGALVAFVSEENKAKWAAERLKRYFDPDKYGRVCVFSIQDGGFGTAVHYPKRDISIDAVSRSADAISIDRG